MNGKVLVIRHEDEFTAILKSNKIEVINLPLIFTKPVADRSLLQDSFAHIESYDGIFFTSPAAANVFLETASSLSVNYKSKIYALGERCRSVFANNGFEVTGVSANTISEFLDSFDQTEFAGKRFLYLRGNKSLRIISERLAEIAQIEEVVVYTTETESIDHTEIDKISADINAKKIEWICFFSPSAVDRFIEEFGSDMLGSLKISAIGKTTETYISAAGFDVEFVSPIASSAAFAHSFLEHIERFE